MFGVDDETNEDAVYIGESELVLDRLYSHITGKDFWSELVAFTSKDDNLTKAHVRYLESRLISLAQIAGRYKMKNNAAPQQPMLPRGERDAMEEYLQAARVLLGALGHRLLEPLVASEQANFGVKEAFLQAEIIKQEATESPTPLLETNNPIFQFHAADLAARATSTDEGIVVFAESEASPSIQSSLSRGSQALRDRLIETGILVRSGDKMKFTRDQLFRSPSQAAEVLVGYSINGREAWRLPNGLTYKEYERQLSESLLNQLSEAK